MNTIRFCTFAMFASILLLVGGTSASAARADTDTAAHPPVQVTYANPANFTENRVYGNEDHYNDLAYLGPLKAFIIKRATPMLSPGQHLRITITDIKLAGAYEPWLGPDWDRVRIMRDIYPPSIDLEFTWTGKNGAILRQGTRKLRDMGYLDSGSARWNDSGPLQYDKALLGNWLRRGLSRL